VLVKFVLEVTEAENIWDKSCRKKGTRILGAVNFSVRLTVFEIIKQKRLNCKARCIFLNLYSTLNSQQWSSEHRRSYRSLFLPLIIKQSASRINLQACMFIKVHLIKIN
jgi:hypothetical protein